MQSFPIRDLFRRLQMSFAGQAEEAGLPAFPRRRQGRDERSATARADARQPGAERDAVQPPAPACWSARAAPRRRQRRGLGQRHRHRAGELPRSSTSSIRSATPSASAQGLRHGPGDRQAAERAARPRTTVRSRAGRGSVFRVWMARVHGEQIESSRRRRDLAGRAGRHARRPARRRRGADSRERRRAAGRVGVRGHRGVDDRCRRRRRARTRGVIDMVISDLRLGDGEDGLRAIEQVRQACGSTVPRCGDRRHLARRSCGAPRERSHRAVQAGAAEGAARRS